MIWLLLALEMGASCSATRWLGRPLARKELLAAGLDRLQAVEQHVAVGEDVRELLAGEVDGGERPAVAGAGVDADELGREEGAVALRGVAAHERQARLPLFGAGLEVVALPQDHVGVVALELLKQADAGEEPAMHEHVVVV